MNVTARQAALTAAAAGRLLHGTNRRRRLAHQFHTSTLNALASEGLLVKGYNSDRHRVEYGHPDHYAVRGDTTNT